MDKGLAGRKFGGKGYNLRDWYLSKEEALAAAKRMRERGLLVRVVKHPVDRRRLRYQLWTRAKGGYGPERK